MKTLSFFSVPALSLESDYISDVAVPIAHLRGNSQIKLEMKPMKQIFSDENIWKLLDAISGSEHCELFILSAYMYQRKRSTDSIINHSFKD